ncbi:MAG: M15 family metallopeptidase [Clostridiales bacterium]|nr:M15 family metallopeptidase [Clostridiales bacterium]
MHDTRTRRYRRRAKMRQLLVRRCMAGVFGILLLMTVWKVTSFAIRQLSPEPETRQAEALSDTGYEKQEAAGISLLQEASSSVLPAEDILLVNKSHPLDDTYRPVLKKHQGYGIEVDASIYDPLNRMLEAGEREGLSFWIASAYRSPDRQRELLDEDIEELVRQGYSYSEAYEEVIKETMPVGCSEHATGLAVDIVAKDYQILDEKQGRTEECKWLQKNCSQYGFILRYPEGKEDITEVSYESWHFRYVGVDAAKEIMSQGITLEEYLESE